MKWTDVYKGPFSRTFMKVFTVNYHMAFDFATEFHLDNDEEPYPLSESDMDDIVGYLNTEHPNFHKFENLKLEGGGIISCMGKPMIIIRGWGYLTGTGGLNLPNHEAATLQDQFANWIISKLQDNGQQ